MTDASGPGVEKRTSDVELFFDLVFVFAITQLTGIFDDGHDRSHWVRVVLALWLVWWAWSLYTWAGNAIDVSRRWVRASLLAITAFTLFMAQAIPGAFEQQGKQFAVSYAVVRVAGLALYWAGLRDRPAERVALWTFLPTSALGATVVLVGGFVAPSVRPWVWAVAVVIDVSSTLAAGRGEFRVAPAHFAERHALFVIIALGESIVAVGVAGSGVDPSTTGYVAAASAIVVIATLWWAYFDWVRPEAEQALVEAPTARRGRLARDLYTLGHIPIVAGTVVFAAGVEEAVHEPLEPFGSFGRWAVGGGIVLYMLGFVLLHARIRRAMLTERLVAAMVVAACMIVSGDRIDAVWILVVLAVLNLALTTGESVRSANRESSR